MIFNDSKYTRWYYQLIEQAKVRILSHDVYTEKHHVIPRSLGGDNTISNLVVLTAREHFIAHWLLTKMTSSVDKSKMWHAFNSMCILKPNNTDKRYVNSRGAEKAKIECAKIKSVARKGAFLGEKNYNYGKKWSEEQRAQMRGHKRTAGLKYSEPYTNERRANMSIAAKARWTEDERDKMRVPKSKYTCNHCSAIVGGKSNYNRWHGDNCKIYKEKLLCQD
jgi:5-methylcytosine-specific restriction endonuclease McrA